MAVQQPSRGRPVKRQSVDRRGVVDTGTTDAPRRAHQERGPLSKFRDRLFRRR